MDALSRYMADDHDRLDRLLDRAVSAARFDHDAFEEFRAGLLRHIGIEEKILLPDARRRRGGEPLPVAARLRLEHAAIASLMVPTPDAALVTELRAILVAHNRVEEESGGAYELVATLAGDEADALLRRAQAVPVPPLARHFDGAGVVRSAADALALAERNAARKRKG
jgi:hypothetical protein